MTTWLPLESNPDVMTKYIHKLGVSSKWNIVDVYGLEPDMLAMIPKPVKAVILLFPCSEAYEAHRNSQDAELKENPPKSPDDLFFMKQIIRNACGTIALVHSIANKEEVELEEGILKNYIEKAKALTADERGNLLESDLAFTEVHQQLALKGQTEANPDEANHHYVSLINKNDELFELDGRKSFPVKHGSTSDDTFLTDAAKVCKEFMAREPDELRFSVIALTPSME